MRSFVRSFVRSEVRHDRRERAERVRRGAVIVIVITIILITIIIIIIVVVVVVVVVVRCVTIGGNGLSESDAAQLLQMLEERNAAMRSNPAMQPLEGLSVDLTLPGEA